MYEVPLPELAEAMRRVGIPADTVEREDDYFQRILNLYGFNRLATQARVYLKAAKLAAGMVKMTGELTP